VAEAHYRESLAIEPQPAVYNDLGFVLEREGMADEAVAMYRKSLELAPGLASAHYNLGAALARGGDLAAAESHFRAALEALPEAKTYAALAFVLAKRGRVDDAIASLRDAIEVDPKYAAAYDQLGTILVEQGKLEEAASTYRLLARNLPTAAAYQKLAQVLTRLGRADEAQQEMEMAKALERNPIEAR